MIEPFDEEVGANMLNGIKAEPVSSDPAAPLYAGGNQTEVMPALDS